MKLAINYCYSYSYSAAPTGKISVGPNGKMFFYGCHVLWLS